MNISELDGARWWDEELDEWSEEVYYQALADYFKEQHDALVRRWGLDCE